mmetsp:Transcript_19542/g.61305  ORF Transcript_19542/g.61305 Transcript_19542/m.61305 type:complete len:220 (+) Transcript_19542:1-660(+)
MRVCALRGSHTFGFSVLEIDVVAVAVSSLLHEDAVELSGDRARLAISHLLAIQALHWTQVDVTAEQHDLHRRERHGHRHGLLPDLAQEPTLLDQVLPRQLHHLPHRGAPEDVVKWRRHQHAVCCDEGDVVDAALGDGAVPVHEDSQAAPIVLRRHGSQTVQHVVVALHPGQEGRFHGNRAHEDFIDPSKRGKVKDGTIDNAIEGWFATFARYAKGPRPC